MSFDELINAEEQIQHHRAVRVLFHEEVVFTETFEEDHKLQACGASEVSLFREYVCNDGNRGGEERLDVALG